MTTAKARVIPSLIIIAALALLPNLCFGWVEIYARPLVQYTWLPVSARKADANPGFAISMGGGTISEGPRATINNYNMSSSSLGGGLALGVVLGKNRQCEVGAEVTFTRYNSTYTVTPFYYYTYSPAGIATRVEPGPAYSGRCNIVVRTFLATYRLYLGKNEDRVRPYFGCFLGTLDATYSKLNRSSGLTYDDQGTKGALAAGLSGGVSIKVASKTYAEVGYRFLYSEEITSHKGLYRNAHMLNLALSQRF